MNVELMDYFIKRLGECFGAPYNLSRHLFSRWGIGAFASYQQIDKLLATELFQGAIFPNGQINLLKRYTQAELEALGASLNPENGVEHEFIDSRFGFRWRQVYHGQAEVWLDLYTVINPQVDESKINEAKMVV